MAQKQDKTVTTDPRAPGRKAPLHQSSSKAEDDVEIASEDSFPASDPPSHTPIRHTGNPKHEREK